MLAVWPEEWVWFWGYCGEKRSFTSFVNRHKMIALFNGVGYNKLNATQFVLIKISTADYFLFNSETGLNALLAIANRANMTIVCYKVNSLRGQCFHNLLKNLIPTQSCTTRHCSQCQQRLSHWNYREVTGVRISRLIQVHRLGGGTGNLALIGWQM